MAYPSLSRRPKDISIEQEANVIKSKFEAGYEHRRKRFTKTRKKFYLSYDLLSEADKDLLVAHFDSVGEYTVFTWLDQDGVSFDVFYAKPLKAARAVPGWFTIDTIELQER